MTTETETICGRKKEEKDMSEDTLCKSCKGQIPKCGLCHRCMRQPRKEVESQMKEDLARIKLGRVLKAVHNFLSRNGFEDPCILDPRIHYAFHEDMHYDTKHTDREESGQEKREES